MRHLSPSLTTTLCLIGLAACATAGRPAESPADTQVEAGATLYGAACAECHDGQLDLADSGPPLAPSLIRSYGTARALFDYVAMSMPWDNPGVLTDEQYWQIIAFLMTSRGFAVPEPLEPANADSMPFIRRGARD